jgi:hypothetical protein
MLIVVDSARRNRFLLSPFYLLTSRHVAVRDPFILLEHDVASFRLSRLPAKNNRTDTFFASRSGVTPNGRLLAFVVMIPTGAVMILTG